MKKIFTFLLAILITSLSFGQISGTFTIPGGTYATIASAIAALNTSGVGSGGVTFNVTAGYTETFSSPTSGYLTITTNLPTVSNQVIFQKSGSGSDPLITAGVGTGNYDAIIALGGISYVTFNGIDLQENVLNTTGVTMMEYGYAILKASGTQGSQNVTIKNCTITLNKTTTNPTLQWGIYMYNGTIAAPTTGLTVTSAAGTNSNNKFYNNTITNCYNGIDLFGYSDIAPYTYYDQNNDIGSVTGNTFTNFAGGASTSYMVYVYYQNGVNIANCNITGTTAGTASIYGIYGGTATNANANIYGNTIQITQSVATTGYIYAFYNSGLGTGGTTNTLNIYNNTIQNCTEPNSTTSYLYAMYNASTAFNINIYGNTVTNNVFGGSYYMYLLYSTSAAGGNINVYNNTISNNQRNGAGTQSGTSYFYCLYIAGSATTSIHDNQVYGNGATGLTTYGAVIYSLYVPSSSTTTVNIYNNTVHDQTVASAYTSSHTVYGMYAYASSATMNVYNNTLYNLTMTNTSTGYGYGYGFYAYATTLNFYKNKIYNVSMPGTSGYFYAIYFASGTTTNAYNNYVSDIRAPGSTSTTAINGMYLSGVSNANIYYNTIYLNASSTSTTSFGTNGIYASTTYNTDMRDNIVINTSTAPLSTTYVSAAYKRSSNALTTYLNTSNNNLFYAGTPSATNLIYTDGTNNIQTLAAYKSFVSPRDASSITEMPPFVNVATTPYDLHIKSTVATQCESGGSIVSLPISVTNDFDGDARYPNSGYPIGSSTPSAPDIGADEFGGIILDLTPPNIGFSPFANTSSTLARLLTTTITDATGLPTSGIGLPRLYWKINSGSWNSVAGTWVSGNTYTFTFGAGVVLNDMVSYYIVAQDIVATPNVGANPSGGASGFSINPPACSTPPTTPYSYIIVGQMCGNYNVGVGQTYTTLTAAVADLNLKEMTCPVTLTLMDATYSASETFPIVLNNVAGSSAVNTITIKPAAGVTSTISGNSATALFKLNQASNVIINGSNSGGTDKSLTFTNTAASGTTAAIWVGSNGTGLGSTNIIIKNCNIACGYSQATSSYGIFVGASTSLGTSGDDNDNLTIQNNTITNASYGVYVVASATGMDDNLLVTGNTMGSATPATSIGYYGVYLSGTNAPVISGNEIFDFVTINSWNIAGINFYSNVPNGVISGNKIHDLQSNSSGGWGCYGISIGYGAASVTNTLITNNLIYAITTMNYSTSSYFYNPFGIWLYSGTGHKIYHNTINMNGTQFNVGSAGSLAACILYYQSTVTGTEVRNNILSSSVSGLAGTQSFCIYAVSGTTFSIINNNDYWPNGTYGVLGYLGANQTTLAAWQTATGQDANSLNIDPLFVSGTDLHPTAAGIQRACPYIAMVTNDYSSALRTNPTDLGGYQVSTGNHSVTTSAATAILTASATLNGSITANNLSVLSGFEYGLTTAYGTVVAGVPATVTGNSATAISVPIAGLTPGTLYHFRAKGTSGSVIVNGSDLTFTTLAIPPTVVTTAAGAVTSTTATVNGTVNANGASTTTSFDYGLTIAYGTNVPGVPLTVTGSTVTGVSAALTGLLPGNTYHYRINGVNLGGTANGNDLTFVTPAAAPTAVTNIASGIGATTATLNGTITANGASTTVTFEYGLTTAYGTTVGGLPSPVNGNTATSVSASLTGLGLVTTYHYRVKGANSQGTTNGNDMTFTTGCPQAGPAGPITGSPTACQGQCNYVYTVAPIANASGYNWTLPVGGTITAGANTNSITVCYSPTAASGTVVVYGTATCGNGSDSQFPVTINPPAAPTIAGPASVCVNSTGNVYTTQSGMTNYQWTVTGGTITGGGGATNNTVTVTWTSSGAKSVCVNYNSLLGCPAIAPVCYTVTVNPLPSPIITGSGVACTNPGYTYSCQAGMTSYVWTITAGGVITGGNNTNTITVTWNTAGAQNVSVNFTNPTGCTAASPTVFPVTVSQTTIPVITGVNSLCANSGYYFYSTQAGMSSYIWNISAGGVLIAGQNTNTIQVQWPQTGAQWVSADFTNASGCYAPSPTVFNVTVNAAPDPAGGISGTLTVCAGANGVAYSCLPIANAIAYVWTLPPGATIASGSGTNSITVNFAANATSGNITVYGNNLCGNGPASPPFPVTVNALPANAGAITGASSVCMGATGMVYSVLPIANATAYVWTVPAGATINGPSNTSSITVDFGPAAVSGNITVLGTNSCGNGNVSPNFAVTVNPIPPAPDITASGNTLSSNAPSGNQWYFEGTAIVGANGQTYVATQTGHYWDIVTLSGCASDSSNHLYVVITGVIELSQGNTVAIYPNPSNGQFTLEMTTSDPQTFDLQIMNNLGVTIYESRDVRIAGTVKKIIDLRPAPDGVYTIVLQNNNNHVVKKIIVNK